MYYTFGNHIYTFPSVPLMYSSFGRDISFSLSVPRNFNIINTHLSLHSINWQSQILLLGSCICSFISMITYVFFERHIARYHILYACMYMYLCTYIHPYSSGYIHPCIHTCLIYLSIHTYIQNHVCVSTYVNIYMYRLMYVCLHIYMHTYIYTCTQIHNHACLTLRYI